MDLLLFCIGLIMLSFLTAFLSNKPNLLISLTLIAYIIQFEFSGLINFELVNNPIVLRFTDIFFAIMGILLLKYLFERPEQFFNAYKKNTLIYWYSIFILFGLGISIFLYGFDTIAEFRSKFFYLIFFSYTFAYIKNIEQAIKLFKLLCYISLSMIIVILINYGIRDNFTYKARLSNALTYITILTGVFIYYWQTKIFQKNNKALFGVIIFMFIIASIFTHHRSGWAAAITVMILIIYSGKINKLKFLYLVSYGLILALLMFSTEFEFLLNRASGIVNPFEDATGNWRYLHWKAVFNEIIIQKNFFGYGIGKRFSVYIVEFNETLEYGAHSGFITMLYLLGIPGVLLFIALYIWMFRKLFKLFKKESSKDIKFIYIVAASAVIINAIYSINYDSEVLTWFLIATAFKVNWLITQKNKNYYRYDDFSYNTMLK